MLANTVKPLHTGQVGAKTFVFNVEVILFQRFRQLHNCKYVIVIELPNSNWLVRVREIGQRIDRKPR